MDADTNIAMMEGDIYRWTYRDRLDTGAWGTYHCCSRIAIVGPNGRLRDTFWSSGSEGRSFGTDDLHRLDLTYIGHLSDLDKKPEYEADYYDDADIVNLNHSNSSRDNFYIRRGAKRSAAKMLDTAKVKLDDAQSDKRMAESCVERLLAAIARIEAGDLTVYF